MTEYQDEAGSYSGELLNGVPHGQGFKIYTPDLYFEGNWEFGYKSGLGFYNYQGEGYCFEFFKGQMKKPLVEETLNPRGLFYTILIDQSIKTEKNGEFYCEKIKNRENFEMTKTIFNSFLLKKTAEY